ncbi:MAG: hypothetical protein HC905_19520 [Bacteroidales bacterium]|nr:hypothetical protein [Bacteroidales bacterium]
MSDRIFETALSPFIAHKENLGYNVIVGYTDEPNVGNTTTSIHDYLEALYNNPPVGISPPHYVLLVGDIAQIPAYSAGWHVTDLYYFDYTSDNIPDVFYGRFSATDTSELMPQINKTIQYELNNMPDPSYQYKAVLVAGHDWAGHDLTFGNGQINYANDYYFNSSKGITSNKYLQPEPSGANYSANIISNINAGVGFANYTAHCSPNGWADPSFTVSNIASLTNTNKYGLWVGNCCLSNKFDVDECFGEAALRAENRGAVGYIGGSNSTYWDEDYWWGVGFKTVTAHPVFEKNHLGVYDRLFHTYTETSSDWYSTQGQLIVGGNLAVEESTSGRKLYYWEIYHLMGDPSLNIRFVPEVDCQDNVAVSNNISNTTDEYLASSSLTASNSISGNSNVHFGALNSITLSPGFSLNIDPGSTFRADFVGCYKTNTSDPIEPPTTVSVPTLSQWKLIFLALTMLILGCIFVYRSNKPIIKSA